MKTKKILLAFVAIAVLVESVASATTSDAIGQIYDAKKGIQSSSPNIDTKDHKDNSLMTWVSTEANPTTVDDEEDNDLRETGGDTLEAGNDTEQGENEVENEYTTSFRAE